MKRPLCIFVVAVVAVAIAAFTPPRALAAGHQHAGTVLDVTSGSLVVDELGAAGKETKLHVRVTPQTRVTLSTRNSHATDVQSAFTSTAIALTDVKKGDFVVVDTKRGGKAAVAEAVTVTLQSPGR